VSFRRKEIISKAAELSSKLELYQAYPNKLSKFETIVQKCSEVGYSKIVFFESERSQKLVISDNKKERLNKIAIEAVELCWGNIIPEIQYRSEIRTVQEGLSILCHTQWADSISLWEVDFTQHLNIIVWPEGWFSSEELQSISAQKVFFWERILRCETVWEVVGFFVSQKKES